ncbi:MAG: nucleotidyltransferase domain-containing protein [Nanoarchaeota archaeon]|nr:nucleotidyltransferase domain-containing protein [Nanoarchaeota archaeon]
MQKELSLIKKWMKKNNVPDVVLFGSSLRGKFKPRDIDLGVLIKDEDEKKSIDLVDSLSKLIPDSHINILTLSSFIGGNSISKTLMQEGYSIKRNNDFSLLLGFSHKSMFVYSLRSFSPSKRVRFHYMLKGRKSKGVLKEVEGKFIGTGSIIVPTSKEDILKEVFDYWNVDYKILRVLLS